VLKNVFKTDVNALVSAGKKKETKSAKNLIVLLFEMGIELN